MVSAWMGSESTLDLVRGGDLGGGGEAGAQLVGGIVERDDDLEVLGLFGAGGGLRGGHAGGAQQGLVADQGDVALEDLAGQGVDGDVGGLADLDVDDVGLVDLDFGGDHAHVGEGHEVEPSVFWMPSTTVSPSRTGSLVTMPSKGAMAMVRSSMS